LRHQWKEEKGLAAFEGRKIALVARAGGREREREKKVMGEKELLSFKMEMRSGMHSAKDARLCIKAAGHTNSSFLPLFLPFALLFLLITCCYRDERSG
jgi:hypothetical protein